MKQSELVMELQKELQKGIVSFKYYNQDDKLDNARGTKNLLLLTNVIPDKQAPAGCVSYWDINHLEWRYFEPEKVISMEIPGGLFGIDDE